MQEVATLGAGCFWCVEAVFQRLEGVESVVSGYSGGHEENPSYRDVCAETTGHAEVCQLTFNPEVISYADILEVFWYTHDPTTLNQQGADKGTQYRSAIFYHSEQQRETAAASKKAANASGNWANPIITEITNFDTFYPAEASHQDYFNLNPNQNYCAYVVNPKVQKFQKQFRDKLKKE